MKTILKWLFPFIVPIVQIHQKSSSLQKSVKFNNILLKQRLKRTKIINKKMNFIVNIFIVIDKNINFM